MTTTRARTTMATFITLAAAYGCTPATPATVTEPAPKPMAPASSNVHPFKIGTLAAFALRDGTIQVPNDGRVVGLGETHEQVAKVLAGAGLSTETVELSLQPLLVVDGGRRMLFDTGAASASFAKAGLLPASLRAAGYAPADITDVFVSHGHPDHVGGLVTTSGALAFPNAVVHLSAPEWTSMKAEPKLAALVAVLGAKVDAFTPGAALGPTVTAVALPGHTPGHSAYSIGVGNERLFFIGDAAHHSVVSVERPDWTIGFDVDANAAKTSRRAFLQRAADEKLRVYGGHFPFPGLGHVAARGDSFVWMPE